MEKTKLLRFKGKPLIEIPGTVLQAGFLEEDFGKAFLKEYQGRVKSDYNGNPNLNVLKYDEGIIKGSNPFAVVLANKILREEGLRTATQADLEQILRANALDLLHSYEDTGLVLRSEEDEYSKNIPLTKDLAEQVKARGISSSPKNPVMIPLTGFEFENSGNSYGLTFKLTDESEIIYAPILDAENNMKLFSETDRYGLPEKLGEGDRTLYTRLANPTPFSFYTRDSGLSRLSLYDYFVLFSCLMNLAYSNDDGRVVVVKPKGTSPKKSKK